MATMKQIKKELKKQIAHSAWRRGVIRYAWELIDNVEQSHNYLGLREEDSISMAILEKSMRNGAASWYEYSWGGCSLCYNADIAQELCTPSELKKTDNGRRRPNKDEEWLDVQARALKQAAHLITSIAYRLDAKGVQA